MSDLSDPIVIWATIAEYLTLVIVASFSFDIWKAYFCYSLVPALQPLDIFIFDAITLATVGYYISPGYIAALIMAGVANYYLIHFSYELYVKGGISSIPKIIGLIDVAVVIIAGIFIGIHDPILSLLFIAIHVLISFWIYSKLIWNTYHLSQRMEDLADKIALYFIGMNGIFFIILYIFNVVHAVIYFNDVYSIFSVLTWVAAIIGATFGYIGFIQPMWFKQRYSGKMATKTK